MADGFLIENNMKRYIYTMRHGKDESVNYQNYSHPLPSVPLCEEGIEEIIDCCKELSKFEFQAILHSPLVRAQQTTKVIKETLKIDNCFCVNDLAEWRPPSSIYGVHPQGYTLEYTNWRKLRHIDFALQFEDGESLEMLFLRAKKIKNELKEYYQSFDRILVVSHLVFMRALYCECLSINHQNGRLYFQPDSTFSWNYCETKFLELK